MGKQSNGLSAEYYELPKGATELQHLISAKNMNAQLGEIFRACYRYGQVLHSPKARDIKKILFYAQAELERLEAVDKVAMERLDANFADDRDLCGKGDALLMAEGCREWRRQLNGYMAEGCREWRRQLNGYMADGETGIRHVGNPDTGPLVTEGAKWVPPRKYAVRITSPIVVEAKEARLAAQHVVDTLYPYSMTLEDVTASDYVEGVTSDALMAMEQLATATTTAHALPTMEASFVGDCDLCGQWADPLVAGVCRECAVKTPLKGAA